MHKNTFGHVLVLAGSKRMLGAAALTGLSALRAGAGLVTVGVPESLNTAVQKKCSNALMTLPLKETREQTLSPLAFRQIYPSYNTYQAIAVGPGLSQNPRTRRLILKVIETSPVPLVIDADALNALCSSLKSLTKTGTLKVLTPHPGEMARLTRQKKSEIGIDRTGNARAFAQKHNCVLLLKGHRTVVASPMRAHTNTTGNAGMATAGSGDVLTGMIAAFLAQGLSGFDAAKWGAYLHGKAGDLAAKNKSRLSMIATDIVDCLPDAIKNELHRKKVTRLKMEKGG